MRLIAPTAFKGTMTPLEAACHIATPGDRLLPLSDGGDGFMECFKSHLGGAYRHFEVADPLGHVRPVPVLELPDGTCVVECARVVGLGELTARVGLESLDPVKASSRGLGDLLFALKDACRIWIGLGGSATVDGGADWPIFCLPPTLVFCDVHTDLKDAARIYGPQKGAKPYQIELLERRLLSLGLPQGPRTGAAGGLGARLQWMGGELVNGAERVLDVMGFDQACTGCACVVTGEGRLDASTLEGKLPAVVARRARAMGLRVEGHFGCRGEGWELASQLFDAMRFEKDAAKDGCTNG